MRKISSSVLQTSDLSLSLLEIFTKSQKELQFVYKWNNETCKSYHKIVEGLQKKINSVAPHSRFDDLTFQDYQNAIELQILQRKTNGRAYSESSINKRRTILMRLTAYIDSLQIGYVDPLWGCFWKHPRVSAPQLPKKKQPRKSALQKMKQAEIDEIVLLPKSLTITAENKLARLFRDACLQPSGEALGGLLMLYLGLRPGECCAVKYGNIIPLNTDGSYAMLYVFEQLNSKHQLKNTLKTKNAYRILPVPEELATILSERKKWISEKISNDVSIETYPIVNAQNNFSDFCTRQNFSKYIIQCLRAVAVDEKSISYSDAALKANTSIKEADATAYLLRRNFATIMASVCAMNEDELQYLMGHELKNGEQRATYAIPEVLMRISDKMNRRHLLDPFPNNTTILQADALAFKNIHGITLVANAESFNNNRTELILDVYTDCVGDALSISVEPLVKNIPRSEILLKFYYDYQERPLGQLGRINMSQRYYHVMIASFNRSQGHTKGRLSE